MRNARTAGARLHSSSTPAILITTALLLGGAGRPLPSARAASAPGGFRAPSSAPLATLRRSRQHPSPHDEEQQGSQMLPLTTAAPRGRGSGRTSPSWSVARTTRGGGIFRRRRGGGGGDGGDEVGGPVSNAGKERNAGEGEDRDDTTSEGFAVAAGTTGGGGDGDGSSSADGQEEEGGTIEEDEGGGSESDDEDEEYQAVLTDDDEQSDGSDADRTDDASEEDREAEDTDDEPTVEEAEEEGDGGEGGDAAAKEAAAAASTQEGERRRPVAPLFSFPPGPRVHRTEAEENLQEVLPMQQRLVKYLTEDRIFGAQILCSVYFFMSAVAYSVDNVKFRGCYHAALAALTLKQWGTVLGRVRRVLVPHLIYEPQSRYVKYRARVSALALDPAVQGIVYCAIFMFMPLGHALLPLLIKESVYLLWVIKEVLQIAAPGLVEMLTSLFEPLMVVFMTAGDGEKWRGTPAGEKRLLLGRRLAQVCFKLEMMMPFSVALRVLPGAVQATLAAGGGVMEAVAAGSAEQGGVTEEEAAKAAAAALAVAGAGTGGGVYGQIARALPLMKVGMLMMAYVKLLTIKNGQLEDDVRILKGLKIRGYNCEWLEQAADSVVFGKMVGCPWWAGLLASGFALLPNHEATKTVMASDDKLKTFGMTLLNLAIGRTPGAEDDEDDEVEGSNAHSDGEKDSPAPKTRMAKIAKIASVATGVSDF